MSVQKIHFFTEDIVFRLKGKKKLREWLKGAALNERHSITELCFIFCSDAYLLEINRSYLDHDTLTDIITFDNSTLPGSLAGDIYISVERIRENAEKFSVSENEELLRVMIHGLLHLCGYKDKEKGQKALMREKEDIYIGIYKTQAI
ncbi:rRNA maturation RNase YbeY [Anseongella ginsenosidimutans]|uniref:Endoribonuclease YbeY n=1 Tax=Anseongella ginsenosidimutans TaxID=496056 RepID=A0A4R3KUV2_9SPHI|nr:rRNA maturation RNase YbeY [Anseongella ginsenosidimutans]QEC51590.1 rRNA maturation RNase YbeY [Anseongella ginsenosidimutans]TCS88918.1 rRNA maturation RNase YbeY [Anseongella ginsenosidimutans]